MGILSMGILYHGIAQLFHMDIAHEESDVLSPPSLSTIQIHQVVDGKLDRQSGPRPGQHNPPVTSTQSPLSCRQTQQQVYKSL